MPNPAILDRLTAAYADQAAHIHAACFAHDPWPAHGFTALLDSGAAGFIAKDAAGSPVGLILYRAAADEAEILTFAVIPEQRRNGIGQFLLQNAIESLQKQKIHHLLLEVAKNNEPAISFYSKAGFSIVGERSGYYPGSDGPIDAFILSRIWADN